LASVLTSEGVIGKKKSQHLDSSERERKREEKLTEQSTEVRELVDLQRFGSIEEVREIEVGGVVADDHVRIDLLDEVCPALEKLFLGFELENLRTDDVSARVEGEDVSDEGCRFA